ncbi:MAG: T9SS type A sorting domain-containing protein [Bacteroidetes bacterium]|nr:T9SS type A sorting domain-containing protein [Bacteroidota bacterium]
MKKLFTIISAVLFSLAAFSQAYNSPESIEYDYVNNRWLIANNNGNNILARNSATGAVTVFAPCSGGPHGIEIVNDTLYVNAGGSIKLFNLNTAASLGTIAMGATFLNGLTHDNTYLYSTDFSAKKIYRINIATRAFSVFVTATGGTSSPNGIIYDGANNRCVFVGWGASAPIKAMDITTGAVTTIITSTLGNCDGITRDATGNYFISSWTGNKITRYTSTFTSPTTVVTGLSSPAEIFYNVLTDTLGNTNSGTLNNTTYHYFGSVTSVDESLIGSFHFSVSPNPIAKTAELKYETQEQGSVRIELFDVKGQLIKTIINETQSKGSHVIIFDRSMLSAGNYFFTISNSLGTETKKVVIVE